MHPFRIRHQYQLIEIRVKVRIRYQYQKSRILVSVAISLAYLLSCSLLLVVSGMKCSSPKTQSKAPARTILASSESSEMGRWSVSWGTYCSSRPRAVAPPYSYISRWVCRRGGQCIAVDEYFQTSKIQCGFSDSGTLFHGNQSQLQTTKVTLYKCQSQSLKFFHNSNELYIPGRQRKR